MNYNLKTQVRHCLLEYPETRNSDITLMLKIWEIYFPEYLKKGATGQIGVWLKDLYELPREDNIKRVRAFFQNTQGLYLPSDPAVRKQRKIEEEKWLEFIRTDLKKAISDP